MGAYASWDSGGAPELETLLELGEGGMAIAYLARTLGAGGFQRLVVLKRLGPALTGSRDAVDRFLAEARLAASVHHANVVGTHQVGRDAAGPYIVLDYVEGGTLDDLVQSAAERRESVPLPVLLRIALDALHGLQAVHEACGSDGRPLAILHRDVSLQNVLVGVRDGIARLADFGVAKSRLSRVQTDPGYLVGKLLYFSPEYLRREPTGPTLDIYAIGVMLWLAINGDDPWPEYTTDTQIIRAIVEEGLPELKLRDEIAPEIVNLVMTACARDQALRYQTAREMAAVLERFDREHGWLATHHEVAELVTRLLGQRLARRRERIAEAEFAARSEAAQPRDFELARTRREISVAREKTRVSPPPPGQASPHPSSPPARLPPARRWPLFALAAAAAVFAGILGLVFASGPELERPSAAANPVPPAAAAGPPLLTARIEPTVEPVESALVPDAPSLPPEPAPSALASASPSPSSKPRRAAPNSAARPAPLAPAATAEPPPAIKKQNPYR